MVLGTDAAMSHELICEWLGLPAGTWPPDHYRLLGLEPGESDAERIEQRIHERLDAVRHYQMAHPEQATEAMNRLAQAYVCLTELASKRAYDAVLFGTAAAVAVAEAPAARPERPDPLAWLFGPAGVPRSLSATPPPLPRLPAPPAARPETLPPANAPEPEEPVDPILVAAQQSRRRAADWARNEPRTTALSPRAGCCTSGTSWANTSSRRSGG